MKKIIGSLLFLMASHANAGYYSATISNLYAGYDGYVSIGFASQPPGTCSSYSWQLRFDGSTPGGKNMLATLMAAKMAGNSVSIWYADSTSPGTNQTNGCNNSTMAVLQGINVDQP